MSKQLDRDIVKSACTQLSTVAQRLVSAGMGPESAARKAIQQTRALFPNDWRLAVQGDDSDEAVEVWEIDHKCTSPIARVLSREEAERRNNCTYCGKPTRKGSALVDGYSAHKVCVKEFEK